jgi:hypothetical protein
LWEVACLERGPLSPVSTIAELLERKCSDSGLENRDYGRRDSSRWPRVFLCPQKLALTSPTSGGRSVGIGRSRTQATEFSLVFFYSISFSGNSRRLWNAAVHYRDNRSSTLDSIQTVFCSLHLNPLLALPTAFLSASVYGFLIAPMRARCTIFPALVMALDQEYRIWTYRYVIFSFLS